VYVGAFGAGVGRLMRYVTLLHRQAARPASQPIDLVSLDQWPGKTE